MRNAFTVDVEDYFQVSGFADQVRPGEWERYESRVVANTERVLRLLDEFQVRGTFFVLGWVAERFPELVRSIHEAGHEVGCHSHWHRLVYDLSPEEFREDLRQATGVLEAVTGEPVTAYRAPSFSVTERSLWALEILIEEGYRVDSSVMPAWHDRYGLPGAPRFPYLIEREQGTLWEFPPTVARLAGLPLPIAGGGYFRLYPAAFSLGLLERINRTEQEPFVFYVHPWEVDPDQPRLPGKWRNRFRHYVNLTETERKLRQLLTRFQFGSLSEVLAERQARREELAGHV